MPNFDPGAKEPERQWYMASRQTGRTESASETQPVQKAEGESYQPRLALRQALGILLLSKNLVCDEEDTERNDSFDWCGGNMNETEGSQS